MFPVGKMFIERTPASQAAAAATTAKFPSQQNVQMTIDDFSFLSVLGRGHFGKVYYLFINMLRILFKDSDRLSFFFPSLTVVFGCFDLNVNIFLFDEIFNNEIILRNSGLIINNLF